MHILLIHQFFLEDNEGGGTRWNDISRIWTEAGHQVTVIAGMGNYMTHNSGQYQGRNFVKKQNSADVDIIRCRTSSRYNESYAGRMLSYFLFVFTGTWAGLFLAREKYDLIVVSSPPLSVGIIGMILSWWKRIPYLFEVRDLWPESAIETGVLKNKFLILSAFWLEKISYANAKLICVLTPAFEKIMATRKHVQPGKIIYCPNAADFELADQVSANLDVATFRKHNDLDKRFVIVYVGAHGTANHLIQIVKAAELLRNTNAFFLLIGDGMEKNWLINESVKRNLANVRFLDLMEKSAAFQYILAADMGASVLQKAETFKTVYSNKTFDYLSCKKPVLMAINGISKTLIEDAKAGVYVEQESPTDFADKVRCYINNPDLLREQGENGYIYAKKYFNRERLARNYLDKICGFFES